MVGPGQAESAGANYWFTGNFRGPGCWCALVWLHRLTLGIHTAMELMTGIRPEACRCTCRGPGMLSCGYSPSQASLLQQRPMMGIRAAARKSIARGVSPKCSHSGSAAGIQTGVLYLTQMQRPGLAADAVLRLHWAQWRGWGREV